MGANCQRSCDNCGKRVVDTTTCPDIDDKRRRPTSSHPNTPTKTKLQMMSSSSSDEYGNSDAAERSSISKYLDNEDTDTYTHEPPDAESSTVTLTYSSTKAVSGFKDAMIKGNEELALSYIEAFPDTDLLSTPFGNGDNCLKIAVQNSSYKLMDYILDQGISVKYT